MLKLDKGKIITGGIIAVCMAVSGLITFGVKSNADELTLTQVKQELDEKDKELEDKIDESTEKDKQIEELNKKIEEQNNTINQLNSSIQNLNEGLNNTNTALDNAKKVQKQDKAEVTSHADTGDAALQQQVDDVKTKVSQPTKTEASGEADGKKSGDEDTN